MMTEITKSASKQTRIQWIDVVRGIIILLMVFGHNIQFGSGAEMIENKLYFENPVFRFIYSFHMPCLMLLSGYFFYHTLKKGHVIQNRLKTILIPAVIWSLIPLLFDIIDRINLGYSEMKVFTHAVRVLMGYYWFCWAIVFSSLIIYIVHKVFNDNLMVYIGIGIVFLAISDRFVFSLWKFMYPYFVTGYLWNLKKIQLPVLQRHKGITTGLLVGIFAALFLFYNTDSFIYTTGIMVRSWKQLGIDIYRYLIGFVGSAMVIWIVHMLYPVIEKKMRIVNTTLVYYGKISLSVYIVSTLLNNYVIPALTKGMKLNYGMTLIETIIVLAFCAFIDWLIKRSPLIQKILLGNR